MRANKRSYVWRGRAPENDEGARSAPTPLWFLMQLDAHTHRRGARSPAVPRREPVAPCSECRSLLPARIRKKRAEHQRDRPLFPDALSSTAVYHLEGVYSKYARSLLRCAEGEWLRW